MLKAIQPEYRAQFCAEINKLSRAASWNTSGNRFTPSESVHKDINLNDFQSELCPPWMGPRTFADVSCTAAAHMGDSFKGIS